jgi:hypothetical protein
MLGCERGPCSEWGHPFSNHFSYKGWFEVTLITDTHVVGEFDIACGRAADSDAPLRIVGRFFAPLGGSPGLRPDHPCAPEPVLVRVIDGPQESYSAEFSGTRSFGDQGSIDISGYLRN